MTQMNDWGLSIYTFFYNVLQHNDVIGLELGFFGLNSTLFFSSYTPLHLNNEIGGEGQWTEKSTWYGLRKALNFNCIEGTCSYQVIEKNQSVVLSLIDLYLTCFM